MKDVERRMSEADKARLEKELKRTREMRNHARAVVRHLNQKAKELEEQVRGN